MDKTITAKATVGTDGVLHLDLPVGRDLAGRELSVLVKSDEPAASDEDSPAHPDNDPAYLALLDELHGGIDDPTFEYPMPGIYEPVARW